MKLQQGDLAEFEFRELDPLHLSYLLYIFCRDDEVIYIGQTKNGLARIGNHYELSDITDKIYIAPSDEKWIGIHEAFLINKYKPKHNNMYKDDYSIPITVFETMVENLLGRKPKAQEIVDVAQDIGARIRMSRTRKVYLNGLDLINIAAEMVRREGTE